MVVNAKTTAGVDDVERNAVSPELIHQLLYPPDRGAKRCRGSNLRPNVDADPMRLEPSVASRARVDPGSFANVDAEFVFPQASRNVRMRLGEDVGIYAESKAGLDLELSCTSHKKLELGFTFHIELENASSEGAVNLRRSFSNARENDFAN